MPVHWYYNRPSLDQDYGDLSGYCKPKNIHPDSIYGEVIILRNLQQIFLKPSKILVKRIHYHQFLEAGDNTLNLQLAAELYRSTILNGTFDPESQKIC